MMPYPPALTRPNLDLYIAYDQTTHNHALAIEKSDGEVILMGWNSREDKQVFFIRSQSGFRADSFAFKEKFTSVSASHLNAYTTRRNEEWSPDQLDVNVDNPLFRDNFIISFKHAITASRSLGLIHSATSREILKSTLTMLCIRSVFDGDTHEKAQPIVDNIWHKAFRGWTKDNDIF